MPPTCLQPRIAQIDRDAIQPRSQRRGTIKLASITIQPIKAILQHFLGQILVAGDAKRGLIQLLAIAIKQALQRRHILAADRGKQYGIGAFKLFGLIANGVHDGCFLVNEFWCRGYERRYYTTGIFAAPNGTAAGTETRRTRRFLPA